MELEYIYCSSCGYESFDEYCAYSRQTANGEWYFCPNCKKETINIDEQEGKLTLASRAKPLLSTHYKS